jgi:hypothetical protein
MAFSGWNLCEARDHHVEARIEPRAKTRFFTCQHRSTCVASCARHGSNSQHKQTPTLFEIPLRAERPDLSLLLLGFLLLGLLLEWVAHRLRHKRLNFGADNKCAARYADRIQTAPVDQIGDGLFRYASYSRRVGLRNIFS